MADNVQWIKLKVGMFDGNSFKKIKRAKIGGISYRDKLTSVWFELLDLAGKSNSNGYLIDNNEIPYHTFEDIACMIDREEKEVELCMQFFISEKMIEIIDDVYCLSNFVKYQNEDGLLRIREQKRIAQAKWRDRKKQGLISYVDENVSTVDSTSNLPSYSYSNSISNNNINNNINNNSNNIEKEIKKEKECKHKYGEYQRVLLTDSQYNKLCMDFNREFIDDCINGLDAYMQSNNNKNKYTDHNLVLRKAIREKWSFIPAFSKEEKNIKVEKQTNNVSNYLNELYMEALEEENGKNRNN